MKRKIAILAVLILTISSFFGCSKPKHPDYKEDKPVSVMSFNVLNGYGNNHDFSDPAIREKWVVEIVNEHSPDLIGFQETSNVSILWREELHNDLCKNGVYDHRDLEDEEDFMLTQMTTGAGLMIFWKADRFEYVDSGCYEYTYFSSQVRYYQWVKLHDKIYDKDVVMTNTHLSINSDSYDGDVEGGIQLRKDEGQELYDFWKANVTGDTVLFATGDYNARDGELIHGVLQTDGTFMPSCDIAYAYDGKTSIDFVYTSPATVEVEEVQTLIYDFRDQMEDQTKDDTYYRASDHHPVMTWAHYK